MGQRGPKPKPTALKQLRGNPGKRAMNKNEPNPGKPGRTPSVPSWLGDDAREIWKSYARQLWEIDLLTDIDVDALAALCESTALYREAVRAIARNGAVEVTDKGYYYASPWVNIRNQALGQMKQLWAVFGMTPSDRSRLNVGSDEAEEVDPFEAFLQSETVNRGKQKKATHG